MRVALLTHQRWLREEMPTLRHLVTGLINEMARVTLIVPDQDAPSAQTFNMFCDVVRYQPSMFSWLTRRRVASLAEVLADSDLDLIHCLDGTLEDPAASLARALNIPVACSVWSRREIDMLRGPGDGLAIAYGAASTSLLRHARQHLGAEAILEHTHPGVFPLPEDRRSEALEAPAESLCVAVLTNGQADAPVEILLDGIAAARDRLGHAVFFFYAADSDQHGIWRAAARRQLLPQITLIRHESDNRRLMIQADAMILPQKTGRFETVVLEAAAAARPMIAANDPVLEELIDEETARLVTEATAQAWSAALLELIDDASAMRARGQAAANCVNESFKVSSQIQQLLQLYGKVIPPSALPFSAAPSA